MEAVRRIVSDWKVSGRRHMRPSIGVCETKQHNQAVYDSQQIERIAIDFLPGDSDALCMKSLVL